MNVYNHISEQFKGKGRCVTMNDAYMSDDMVPY